MLQSNNGLRRRQNHRRLEREECLYGRHQNLLFSWTHQSSPQVHHLLCWRWSRWHILESVTGCRCLDVVSCNVTDQTFFFFFSPLLQENSTSWPQRIPAPPLPTELFSSSGIPPGKVCTSVHHLAPRRFTEISMIEIPTCYCSTRVKKNTDLLQ